MGKEAADVMASLGGLVKAGQKLLAQLEGVLPSCGQEETQHQHTDMPATTGANTPEHFASVADVATRSMVRVTDDVCSMLEACRTAGMLTYKDHVRIECAGKVGKVMETDASDNTARIAVNRIGKAWFPLPALSPVTDVTVQDGDEADTLQEEESEEEYEDDEGRDTASSNDNLPAGPVCSECGQNTDDGWAGTGKHAHEWYCRDC